MAKVQSFFSLSILQLIRVLIVILNLKKTELVSIMTAMLGFELFIRDLFKTEAIVPSIEDGFDQILLESF